MEIIYSTYVNDPKSYKPYDLYALKVWVLREFRRMNKEPKFEIYIVTHGLDENTEISISHVEVVAPNFYDLCDLNFSLYHDYTVKPSRKFDEDNITIFDDVSNENEVNIYEGVKLPEDVSYITVELYYEGNMIIPPKEHVNYINEYIRLNINDFKFIPILEFDDELFTNTGDLLPMSWVRNMLRFINLSVPWKLESKGLFVNLESQIDFTDTLSGIYESIISKLSSLYYLGYIYLPPKELIKSWNINPVGTDGLYRVNLSDKFMRSVGCESPVDFILSRIYGTNYIDYEIGDNVLIRHMISKALHGHQITMIGMKVRVTIENYDSAIKVMNIIEGVIGSTYPDTTIHVAPLDSPVKTLF